MEWTKLFSKRLFWDVDSAQLALDKDAEFIVPRVFMRGTVEEMRNALKYYGEPRCRDILTTTRYLDKKTLALCTVLFDLEQEAFRCYRLKQLNQLPWDY